MAAKRFLLQGFTPRTHLEGVAEVLGVPKLERAILSVAYVSDSGVSLLSAMLLVHAGKVVTFAGIRNEITSRQGLERLLMSQVRVVTVDTGSTRLTYHPKLYYSRGADEARIVVGSANLTTGGLNNNIEASVLLRLDLSNKDDFALAQSVEHEFDRLEETFPLHICEAKDSAALADLQRAGRLLDESETWRPRVTRLSGRSDTDSIPLIRLEVEPITTAVKRPQGTGARKDTEELAEEVAEAVRAQAPLPTNEYELVWESKPLTERDLTIPRAKGTNQTGSMNLDKGLLAEEIDHRHYFRDQVFDKLRWRPRSTTVEETTGVFHAVLKGSPVGTFTLRIGHTISTDTASYHQHNAMTRLSWGDLSEHIQRRDLLERTARLYRSFRNPTEFLIEID